MKKKIEYIIITAVISMSAFFVGKNMPSENYLNMETVTDYSASENRLMLYTSDGTGYYWEKGEQIL